MKTGIIFLLLTALALCTTSNAADLRDVTLENATLDGVNTFSGSITIRGQVSVPEGSSLTVTAGTDITFIFVDDDGDGLGESELISQGSVTVTGTAEKPVRFHADRARKGAWLGVSVMNVDKENIFEHVVFEDSYMALHSHFSNLTVKNSVFRNNMRGFQSQEGSIIIARSRFSGNNSGIQFRNSRALIEQTEIDGNEGGLNFLYSTVTVRDTTVTDNALFGVRIRFSKADIEGMTVSGSLQNVYGKNSEISLTASRSDYSTMRGFSFEGSILKMKNCAAAGNFLDGMSLDSTIAEFNGFDLRDNARFHLYLKGSSSYTGVYRADRSSNVVFTEK